MGIKTFAKVGAIALSLAISNAYSESLTEVYDLALKNDPIYKAAIANKKLGDEYEKLGLSSLLPQIGLSGAYSDGTSNTTVGNAAEVSTDTTSTSYQANLSQVLFDWSAFMDYKGSKARTAASAAQFGADQQDLIVRVTRAYLEVIRAHENLETASAEERALQRRFEQVQQRFDVGLIAITDVHESRAAYDSSVARRLEAEGNLGIAFEALEVLTGRPHNEVLSLGESFPVRGPEPAARSEWVNFAMANNLDLKVSEFNAKAAKAGSDSARGKHLPTLSGSARYSDSDSDSATGNAAAINTLTDGTTVGLSVSMPLFTGGAVSSQRRQALEQYHIAQEQYVLKKRNTIQDARSQHLKVVTGVAQVEARRQAIVSAQSALDATQAGYEVGTRNIVDVLNVQNTLYSAKRNYTSARIDYILNTLGLHRVAGTLSTDDLTRLDQYLQRDKPLTRYNGGQI